MDDIGSILYIIFTLVAIVLGMFGSKNKKRKPGQQKQAKPGFMEELERVLQGGSSQPAEPIEEEIIDMNFVEEEHYLEEEPYGEEAEKAFDQARGEAQGILDHQESILEAYDRIMSSNQTGEEQFQVHEGDSEMDDALQIENLEEEGALNFSDLVENFDARAAILYSEIINRKEF